MVLARGRVFTVGAYGKHDLADLGHDCGWNGGDDYGDGFPGGGDGEPGRDSRDGRDGGKQHFDYSGHRGARGGCSECSRDQHRCPERHLDQRLYLHFQHRRRADQFRSGEVHPIGKFQFVGGSD